MSVSKLWFEHALMGDAVREAVGLSLAGDRIERVECGVPREWGDEAYPGLAVPGAANGHSHAFQRALRGLGDAGATFWQWRDAMYEAAARLTPELAYRVARGLYTEMLCAGYTTVAEFHYVHHRTDGGRFEDPNAIGLAIARAAHDAGIRLTLLDTCYLHADVEGSPCTPGQTRFCDGDAASWLRRVDALAGACTGDPRVRVGAAVHSVRACQPDEIEQVAGWAHDGGRPLHVHLSEQTAENEACMAHAGLSPAALLDRAGFWAPGSCAVHATHLSEGDIRLLAERGAGVVLCPSTEADLADGIGPAAALADAGVPLAIGSDENVMIDPYEEVRRLDAGERLVSGARDRIAAGVLRRALFEDGQLACGWPDSGAIGSGYLADLVVLDTHTPRNAGVNLPAVPLVSTAADVTDVFVGGAHVVERGGYRAGFDVADYEDALDALRGDR